jgi:hypothetical protein
MTAIIIHYIFAFILGVQAERFKNKSTFWYMFAFAGGIFNFVYATLLVGLARISG